MLNTRKTIIYTVEPVENRIWLKPRPVLQEEVGVVWHGVKL